MTHNTLSKVRKLAVALVLGNLALIGLLALILPGSALFALPVLALMLPLLSAAAIESALTQRAHEPAKPGRVTRLHLRALRQAA
jgi:hypothetical protein